MIQADFFQDPYSSPGENRIQRSLWDRLHLDPTLFSGIAALLGCGLFILYSADNQSLNLLLRQAFWSLLGVGVMLFFAQIPPRRYQQWAPFVFSFGLALLIAVLLIGHTGKGAQRWIGVGSFQFQPSEIMKLAIPMMLARFLDYRHLPPNLVTLVLCALILAVPFALIAKQPDLGTGLIVLFTGGCVLLLSGMRWLHLCMALICMAGSVPFLWHFLHDYQRERVLTFLNPERDPLDTGYHIIQSKIAIGSGGMFGKGYLQGTQSHLQFLPEHETDFIFAVAGEELGLIGVSCLILIFTFVVMRGLYISGQAQDTFSRLLAGSLSLTFFLSYFINIGMVTGILPVVGVPLPLVSYGGSAMLTTMAMLGVLMSIHTHRKLLGR